MLEITPTTGIILLVVSQIVLYVLVLGLRGQASAWNFRTNWEPRYRGLFLFPEEPGIEQRKEISILSGHLMDAGLPGQFCADECTLDSVEEIVSSPNKHINLVHAGGHSDIGIIQLYTTAAERDITGKANVTAPVQTRRLVESTDLVTVLKRWNVELLVVVSCNSKRIAQDAANSNITAVGFDGEIPGPVAAYWSGMFYRGLMVKKLDPWQSRVEADQAMNRRYGGIQLRVQSYIYPELPPSARERRRLS